ncbi:MAG: FAD-binding oxidoreductase [Microbacterium sp.]
MRRVVCDVAVIGGGMGGASVAAELAATLSVALVEAESAAGEHSTGRSAAAFLPSYGGPVVRQLTVASRPLYDARSAELGFELLNPRPLIWLGTNTQGAEAVDGMVAKNDSLVPLPAIEAVALFPPLRPERVAAAALDSSATDIDVAALHQAYLADLKNRKGSILLRSPAQEIRQVGSAWEVTAGDSVITCAKVVNAAGAWADEVAQRASVPTIGLRPKRRTAFVSPPVFAGEIAELPLLSESLERWYVKPEAGLALGSPADESDSAPGDVKPDELEIARAIDEINEVTTLGLRSVRRAWAGLRSFVADRSPVVGSWSDHEGFYFVAGQGGYGIQMAPALARVAADIVAEDRLSAATEAYGVSLESLSPERLRAATVPAGV